MKTEGQITTLVITDRDKSLKRRLSDIIHGATPGKAQTGKKMNRRFQTGSISKHGNWWVVRFRVDTPGQTKRQLRHERICPTFGPGLLNSFERKQRAQEILQFG